MKKNYTVAITSFSLTMLAYFVQLFLLGKKYIYGLGIFGNGDTFSRDMHQLNFSGYWPVLQFFLVTAVSYLIFAWIIYYFVLFLNVKTKKISLCLITVLCWAIAYFSVLTLNANLFPNSFFASSFFIAATNAGHVFTLYRIAFCILLFVICAALSVLIKKIMRHKILSRATLLCALFIFFGMLVVFIKTPNSDRIRAGYQNTKP